MTDTSRINLVRRRDKKQYAKGNLLIDDLPKNIAEWKVEWDWYFTQISRANYSTVKKIRI